MALGSDATGEAASSLQGIVVRDEMVTVATCGRARTATRTVMVGVNDPAGNATIGQDVKAGSEVASVEMTAGRLEAGAMEIVRARVDSGAMEIVRARVDSGAMEIVRVQVDSGVTWNVKASDVTIVRVVMSDRSVTEIAPAGRAADEMISNAATTVPVSSTAPVATIARAGMTGPGVTTDRVVETGGDVMSSDLSGAGKSVPRATTAHAGMTETGRSASRTCRVPVWHPRTTNPTRPRTWTFAICRAPFELNYAA